MLRFVVGRLLVAAVAAALPAAAQFGQNKITYQDFDWHVYRAPHFDVHYYPAIEPFLEEIVSYAESAYLKISKDLDHELSVRVPLVVYKTQGEFQQTNITLAELPGGVAAFAEPVQYRMVLPIDHPPDELYELIAHELVHIFEYSMFYEGYLGRALRANAPTWLMEGLASYLAQDESNFDRMAIRDAVVNNILPPIESLDVVTFLTYRYGHAIFDYIEQEHGAEGLRNFLFEFKKVLTTGNLGRAVKESFGYELDEFNRRFNQYLRRKYFPVLLEKKSPADYGREIGVRKPGVYTFSPTISPSGELVAALSTPTRLELDLVVLSAEGGKKVKNLTKGWTTRYRFLSTATFEGKRDLSWSPVADRIAVFAQRENRWPLLIYDALSGKLIEDVPLDNLFETASPAFSPDGRRVAFEANRDGVVDLFEVDLETREVRNLTQDDFFDTNPWYAADGQSLLYNRRIGPYWKIFSVDLADPARKTQITFGQSSDIQPSYARDGKSIFFASDRGPYGVFNIHGLDLETGETVQYTDVVGGCMAPQEMAERDGERYVVFQSYFDGTFRLYRMALRPPEPAAAASAEDAAASDADEIPVADEDTAAIEDQDTAARGTKPIAQQDPTRGEPDDLVAEALPFEPPLKLRVDESQKSKYKARWDIEAPQLTVGVTNDGTFLADGAVQFTDLLGDQRFSIVASTVSDFATFSGSYINLKQRFDWGGTIYDYRDFFLVQGSAGLETKTENRATGGFAFWELPLSRYYRVTTTLGGVDTARLVPSGTNFVHVEDTFATASLAFIGDTTRYQSFGPFQGKRFNVGVRYGAHVSGDSPGDQIEYRLDYRGYKQLTRRSLFAWRLASIYNAGDTETVYGFGGINQLRGYDYREFSGSRLAWSNLELRFPLAESINFPVLSLVQIRGFLFLDVGAAWLVDDLYYDPQLGIIRRDLQTGRPIKFDFWDSDNDRLQDGRASWGMGFQFFFLGGLQFNWSWAQRTDYTQFVYDPGLDNLVPVEVPSDGKFHMDFYIAFDF